MLFITQYYYSQCDRTNVPVKEIGFPGKTEADVIACLESAWPSHAPFEKYEAWGMGKKTYIGSLAHTFRYEDKG